MQTQLMIRAGRKYRPATKDEVSEVHAEYVAQMIVGADAITSPETTQRWLREALAGRTYESFSILFLNNRHRVIKFAELFRGTIDGASVFPREVVKAALAHNAAAVILAHNHPSGNPEPSAADEMITTRLRKALELVDIRVLDHVIVTGDKCVSFAARGML